MSPFQEVLYPQHLRDAHSRGSNPKPASYIKQPTQCRGCFITPAHYYIFPPSLLTTLTVWVQPYPGSQVISIALLAYVGQKYKRDILLRLAHSPLSHSVLSLSSSMRLNPQKRRKWKLFSAVVLNVKQSRDWISFSGHYRVTGSAQTAQSLISPQGIAHKKEKRHIALARVRCSWQNAVVSQR